MSLVFDPVKHEYCLDGLILPSVTYVMKSVGLTNFVYDEVSMRLGTIVHELIEAYESKWVEREPTPEHLIGYLSGWQKAKVDLELKVLMVERPLSSRLGYAGKFDVFGETSSGLILIDIKTGAAGLSAGIQLAAYKNLIVENFQEYRGKPIREIAMELGADGTYRIKQFAGYDRWPIFLSALNVVNYKRNHNADCEM